MSEKYLELWQAVKIVEEHAIPINPANWLYDACREIIRLSEENARLREMVRWRKYPDEKPEKSGDYYCEVMLVSGDLRYVTRWFDRDAEVDEWGFETMDEVVLRWTFLPKPPEVE